jgi:hypothetical protein
MRPEDVARAENGIVKTLHDYRRLTGQEVAVDLLVAETTQWIQDNFDNYMRRALRRHTGWMFPPNVDLYASQGRRLANNEMETFIDTVEAMADAHSHKIPVGRYRRRELHAA